MLKHSSGRLVGTEIVTLVLTAQQKEVRYLLILLN